MTTLKRKILEIKADYLAKETSEEVVRWIDGKVIDEINWKELKEVLRTHFLVCIDSME